MPYVTIKEAAERLGVSEKTARRMVRDGRLNAELREGPYGRTYYIDEADIQTAQEIVDIVPVTRSVSVEALADAVAARIQETLIKALEASAEEQARTRAQVEALTKEQTRGQEALQKLTHEVETLREELAASREAQERIERSIEERDRKLMEVLRTLTERKKRPWWRRIFEP